MLSLLLFVGGLAAAAGTRTGATAVVSRLAQLPVNCWRGVSSYASRKWDNAFAVEPDSRERLMYLLYYWRARLRWPIRLVGVLLLLLLAWRYPWRAYAVVVLGASAAATWAAPYLPFFGALASPRPVVGSLGGAVCLLCWMLPYTTAWIVGLGLWALVAYVSWQLCAGMSALLLTFYYLPTLALGLVRSRRALFLIILPRICIFV